MAADRIRESSPSIAQLRNDLEPQRNPASRAVPSQARNAVVPENGFDVGGPHFANARTSGSFDAPLVAQQPHALTQAEVPANPHAQLDALKTQMSLQEKKEFLAQFGVKEKHLKKARPHEIDQAFAQVIDQLKEPGKAKLKMKIGGKKYEARINLDPNSGQLDIQFKEKKGFFGKLWDGVKKVGKIALTVASFIPGPVGIVARVANAVISSVSAFKKGDILGGIAGLAGGIAGGAGALAGKAVSGVARTVSTIAGVVEKGATAAQGVANAIKNKNWGGLLTAVASGASGISGALGNSARGLANTMNQVSTWATRGNTALQAAVAARNGDIVGMLSQGSQLATGIAPNSRFADTFQRIASGAQTAQHVVTAARQGDVLGALSAGAGFASQQVRNGSQAQSTLQDVSQYALTARNVQQALSQGDYMGAARQAAGFASSEVTDPRTRLALQKASQIFSYADGVENAIQAKDFLAAAAAASTMAGNLTGSDEAQDAGRLLAAAGQLRAAVNAGNAAKLLAALGNLRETIQAVTQQSSQRTLPQPQALPLPPVATPPIRPNY